MLEQFVQNRRILNQVHEQLTANGGPHGIDAEWLIDNFHIIEDSLREVRRDLPPGYDELLPKLSVPPLLGYPRVYAWPWSWSPTPTASWTRPASHGLSGRFRKGPR